MQKSTPQTPFARISGGRPAPTLHRSDPPEKTLATLQALLDIVGPAEAPALVTQLLADLTDCDAVILDAAAARDWQALRLASHNLTALAGTAGEAALQHMAEALNRAAHARDLNEMKRLAPMIGDALAALTGLIRALGTSGEGR